MRKEIGGEPAYFSILQKTIRRFLYFLRKICYTYTMQQLLKKTKAYRLLKNEGKTDGFAHAYLLVFDDGKNLRAALRCFAKLLFGCDEPYSPAEKRMSELIDGESFSDCVCYPVEGKKLLVEDAENILEESTLAPVEGEVKVFLIGDFSEANVQTQNKLLKVLEEPPKGVIFLLGATSEFSVLPTVLSRTKKLEILPFSIEEVGACLRRKYENAFDEQLMDLAAAASGGNVGNACAMLEGGNQEALIEQAFSLARSPLYKLPAVCKQVGETPFKRELLNLLRLIFRDALLIKSGIKKLLLPSERTRTAEVANNLEKGALLFAQEAITQAEKQVKFNAVFSHCIEVCIASILAENEKYKV